MTKGSATNVRWIGLIAIIGVHVVAIGLLFLLVVFVGDSFVNHYKAIAVASTPRFDAMQSVANFLAKYSIVVVAEAETDDSQPPAVAEQRVHPSAWFQQTADPISIAYDFRDQAGLANVITADQQARATDAFEAWSRARGGP